MESDKSLIPISQAVETIKTAILQGQHEALKGANRVQLAVYYGIGKYLSKNTRHFAYGTGALKAISEQLRKEMPGLRGFSESSLKNMRLFYEHWQFLDRKSSVATDKLESEYTEINSPIAIGESVQQHSPIAIGELEVVQNEIDIYQAIQIPNTIDFPIEDFFNIPFTHHVRIIEGVNDLRARYYYIHRVVEEKLSVESLKRLIKQQAFEHQAQAPNNFVQTLSNSSLARKAVMMFKDSYTLEFINTEQIGEREAIDVDERVVEQQIVENVKKFIMTFGNDFAFVGNQYHLEVHGVEHFPDLLFFNRELNALVVVELKTGEFKSSYLGQLMSYLSILDAKVKKAHENPSIGIVLCKSANKDYVQFVIKDYSKPMGVATYTTAADMPENLRNALPKTEDLLQLLHNTHES